MCVCLSVSVRNTPFLKRWGCVKKILRFIRTCQTSQLNHCEMRKVSAVILLTTLGRMLIPRLWQLKYPLAIFRGQKKKKKKIHQDFGHVSCSVRLYYGAECFELNLNISMPKCSMTMLKCLLIGRFRFLLRLGRLLVLLFPSCLQT